MSDSRISTVKSVTFHPVLNGKTPIDIPVSIDLSFKNGPSLTYDTSNESQTFNVDPFELTLKIRSDVTGKLYAMDRRRGSDILFYPTSDDDASVY